MRLIILLLIGVTLGIAGGVWQSKFIVTDFPDQIGEKLDEAQIQAISRLEGKEEEIREKGILSADVVPKVEVVGGTDFDFGTMKRGSKRSHKFIFKNTGNADLKLKVVGSTCKCTVGKVKEEYIKPGDETSVELTWTADGVQPDFAQTATIETTDPRMREIKLTITGRIGTNYVITPDELNFGEFSSHEEVTRTFKVYALESTNEDELLCAGYWGDVDLVDKIPVSVNITRLEKGQVPEFADARWVGEFTVTIKPGWAAGPLNGQVRLELGPERYPMSVPTTGKCVSDLRVLASRGFDEEKNLLELGTFNGAEGGESQSFFVSVLSSRKDVTLEVSQILPDYLAKDFKVEIGEPIRSENKSLFPVKFVIPPGTPPIDRGGSNPKNFAMVYFKANLENAGEISIFLRFKVK